MQIQGDSMLDNTLRGFSVSGQLYVTREVRKLCVSCNAACFVLILDKI